LSQCDQKFTGVCVIGNKLSSSYSLVEKADVVQDPGQEIRIC